MSKKYAIIDVEATGSVQRVDRITEIGIVLFDGHEIEDTYTTLINPGISIPPFITRLTGISNDDVKDAPQFYEIAKDVVEWTQDRQFVAHNVSYDYRMIREEFQRLGFDYKRDTLCTARLSRHFFPEIEKHSLSFLIKHFKIDVNSRHRAMDDAIAAAEVFRNICLKSFNQYGEQDFQKIFKRKMRLPDAICEEDIADLPNSCGVYYMNDRSGKPVYIGKSLRIRTRIRSHFAEKSIKADRMRSLVHSISYTETGSELMAEIRESLDIRKYQPDINRAKRKNRFPYVVFADLSGDYYSLNTKTRSRLKSNKNIIPLQFFSSKRSAKQFIVRLADEAQLCHCQLKLNNVSSSCLHYKTEQCAGAYYGKEQADDYNKRIIESIELGKRLFENDYILIDRGRNPEENSLTLIEEGVVKAIGYLSSDETYDKPESIKDQLDSIPYYREINSIAFRFLNKKKLLKVIRLNQKVKQDL
jgi:DNA polymerase-3 subunit epsilon